MQNRCKFWISQPQAGGEVTIPNNICMPIWQAQIQEIVIWNSPTGDMFQRKIYEIFRKLPNVLVLQMSFEL